MGLLERFILLLMAMNQAAGGLSVRWDDAERLNHKLMKHKVIFGIWRTNTLPRLGQSPKDPT